MSQGYTVGGKEIDVEIDEHGDIRKTVQASEPFEFSPLPSRTSTSASGTTSISGLLIALISVVGIGIVVIGVIGFSILARLQTQSPTVAVSPTNGVLSAATNTPVVVTATTEVVQMQNTNPSATKTFTPSPILLATKTSTPLPTAVNLDRILIPTGNFTRGSSREDIRRFVELLCSDYPDSWCREDAFEDELPRTEILKPNADIYYIQSRTSSAKAFYIDRHEVTNTEYAQCVNAGVCTRPQSRGSNPRRLYFGNTQYADYPVIYVTWNDAFTYCRWVGGRLPTADEWEKAARGTDGRLWPWGDEKPTTQANFRRPGQEAANEEKDGATLIGGSVKPVMSYPKDISPYEVWDMAGNVMEWVNTRYSADRYEIRGGSWNTGSFTTRTASRVAAAGEEAYFDVGFRCAYDAVP